MSVWLVQTGNAANTIIRVFSSLKNAQIYLKEHGGHGTIVCMGVDRG